MSLETTFDGAGVVRGDLTPQCAAMVQAVLDALSAPAGGGDLRTRPQRYHDALEEAMRSLGFCIMMDAFVTHGQTGTRPSPDGRVHAARARPYDAAESVLRRGPAV